MKYRIVQRPDLKFAIECSLIPHVWWKNITAVAYAYDSYTIGEVVYETVVEAKESLRERLRYRIIKLRNHRYKGQRKILWWADITGSRDLEASVQRSIDAERNRIIGDIYIRYFDLGVPRVVKDPA